MNGVGNFQEKKIHPSRISTIDISDLSLKKHHMKALIELDVTAARDLIREYKKMGKGLTFTAWIIKCISESMEENKSVNAYVNIKKRTVVTFEDIDITVMVEKRIGGEDVPLPYVIRKTSEKSMAEIHEEIKAAKAREITGEDFVFERNISPLLLKIGLSMPQFIRKLFWRRMMGDPFFAKKIMGTAAVTSVGMCGQVKRLGDSSQPVYPVLCPGINK